MRYKTWAILLSVLFGALPAFAQSSLAQRAATQFRTAEKAEAALYETPQSDRQRTDYLKVIRAYERVYLITPHTAWADNALTSIARLYEEMKDAKNAVKTLRFLLTDYPQTPFRDVAERDIARLTRPNDGDLVPRGDAVPKTTSSIENIRFWEQDQSIRVAVDLDGDVKFESGEAKSPDRYFIDIRPARLNSLLLGREWVVNSKLIQRIRVAQYEASTVRIVLDGATLKNVTTSNLKDPSRIVMDVAPVIDAPVPTVITRTTPSPSSTAADSAPALLSANTQPPTAFSEPPRTASTAPAATSAAPRAEAARVNPAKPATTGDRSLIRSLGLKLSRVVIDAGHGGYDVGSIGPTGFTEKELVLDVAKRLKALIESEMGAEVVMTRDSDEFVPLESRTEMANSEKADLFISIHANSSTAKSVRGVETFFLNLNTQSRDALATAARENAASEKKIHELQDILQKIVLNAKTDESRELAEHIQLAMSKRRYAGTNRGVKQAPFVVLIGATMPSVLAEVSFITNPEEERRLKTSEYRQQIAEALFKGIKSYSETLSSTKTAN